MLYDSGWVLPLGTPGNSLLPAVQLLCLCSLAPCGECDQLLAMLPVQAFSRKPPSHPLHGFEHMVGFIGMEAKRLPAIRRMPAARGC